MTPTLLLTPRPLYPLRYAAPNPFISAAVRRASTSFAVSLALVASACLGSQACPFRSLVERAYTRRTERRTVRTTIISSRARSASVDTHTSPHAYPSRVAVSPRDYKGLLIQHKRREDSSYAKREGRDHFFNNNTVVVLAHSLSVDSTRVAPHKRSLSPPNSAR